MKKMWAWILMTILMIGMLPGCSQEGGESSVSDAETESAVEQSKAEEVPEDTPLALTFLCQINVDTEGYDVNDNPYINYIREANNLDITLISESANYASKVSTIMSSGELPDYVQLTKALYFQYAQGGLLLELDGMLNETDYPNLMSGVSEEYWGYSKVDGKIYGIPFVRYDTTPDRKSVV